jgi:hypothetical protein
MDNREQDNIADKIERTRTLNDVFRRTGQGGKIMITQGISQMALPLQAHLMGLIRQYDEFSSDNDQYGEHDFGALKLHGESIFWKIDYYDQSLEYGSPDPADADITIRVMTVMFANEY